MNSSPTPSALSAMISAFLASAVGLRPLNLPSCFALALTFQHDGALEFGDPAEQREYQLPHRPAR
jgi:hypothetical protein